MFTCSQFPPKNVCNNEIKICILCTLVVYSVSKKEIQENKKEQQQEQITSNSLR